MELTHLKEQPSKPLENTIKISQSDNQKKLIIRISNDLADKTGLTHAKFARIKFELDPEKGFGLALDVANEKSSDYLTIKPIRTEMHVFITIPVVDGWPIISSTIKIKKFELLKSIAVSNENDILKFYIPNKHIKKFKGTEKRVSFCDNFSKQISKDRKTINFETENFDDFVKNVVPQILQHDGKVFNLAIKGFRRNQVVDINYFFGEKKVMFSIEEVKSFLLLLKDSFKFDLKKINGQYYRYEI